MKPPRDEILRSGGYTPSMNYWKIRGEKKLTTGGQIKGC
jgi:phage/plasmid primase-like uncharacterized protein